MRLIDLYYEAFKAFRKYTQDDLTSQKLRHIIAQTNPQKDNLNAIKYSVAIELDWIENIEEGLIYVEKAIREDRQFIRTEGEVVQIEKVKRVSKASVEHLSRHSDLITRAPADGNPENIIPDKLYIVEKLSDYLVYENRFLYMLLCYLKDFIQMRLDKIRDKTTTYESDMTIDKDIKANQRRVKYQLNYQEVSKNDPFLIDAYKDMPMVNRLETIYAMVVSFLATPLMKEVSKAPMIKPPVVKTNVLRMNPNFRAALKLYDYITSYNKDGYSFNEIRKTFNPFPQMMADQIADLIEIKSVIAYISGNDLEESLLQRLEDKIEAQKEIDNQKAIDEIKRLKKRIIEMNEDPAEYILKLEKRNISLEKDHVNLGIEKEKNQTLQSLNEALEKEKVTWIQALDDLKKTLEEKNIEIDELNQKYYDDMTLAEEIHTAEMVELKTQHQSQINTLQTQHQAEIQSINDAHLNLIESLKKTHEEIQQQQILNHEKQIELIRSQFNDERAKLTEEHDNVVLKLNEKHTQENQHHEHIQTTLNAEIQSLKSTIQSMNKDFLETANTYELNIDELERKLKRMEDEKHYVSAQFLAFKAKEGLLSDSDDYTSKERFKQLELEMAAYKKLFKEQWKQTKQKIRDTVKKENPVIPDKLNKPEDSNQEENSNNEAE
ncbi:hypothetical protein [Paracholeplasma manati]|uniref:hypothetical protein n=1 Tax=Paracholeplasma manati TaxID=591373 RepID=UPI00240830F8|nr:hypothetical protein [Paracholeplasma manati]MDG0889351.1 hypothetical protein [Paracholeplasma manati]